MTMPSVSTTEAGMQRAAQEFSDKATEFTSQLRAVNGQMAVLISSWTGQASQGFNQAMDNWENAFQRVINELLNMLEVMGVTTKGYQTAEDEASSVASSFGAALPGI
ncbi:WXG100 family type VII secretion target [Micromonospora chalcea]|uniref:WXG100 family type VII secretion target n=1 Tax=Micromonospora chalcea TaxID=1874 RepID=UPI0021A40CEE|nr:WXG100 family type VII secretion target [Micromonospora chalcea]MCT2277754.1 WXG100 family type VII secretion target [Micromonospora chalcea]